MAAIAGRSSTGSSSGGRRGRVAAVREEVLELCSGSSPTRDRKSVRRGCWSDHGDPELGTRSRDVGVCDRLRRRVPDDPVVDAARAQAVHQARRRRATERARRCTSDRCRTSAAWRCWPACSSAWASPACSAPSTTCSRRARAARRRHRRDRDLRRRADRRAARSGRGVGPGEARGHGAGGQRAVAGRRQHDLLPRPVPRHRSR